MKLFFLLQPGSTSEIKSKKPEWPTADNQIDNIKKKKSEKIKRNVNHIFEVENEKMTEKHKQ